MFCFCLTKQENVVNKKLTLTLIKVMNYKIKNSASFTQSLILSFSPLNPIAQLIVYLGIELVMNHINLLQQEEFVVLAEVLYDICT